MTASVLKSIFIYKFGNDEGLKRSITVISKRIFISTVNNCIFMQKIYPHGCFIDKHIESQKHQEIVTFLIKKKKSLQGLSFLYDSSSQSTDLIYLRANAELASDPGNLNFIFIYIFRVFTHICIHSVNKKLKE